MALGYRISNRWAGNLSGQSYDDVTFQSGPPAIEPPFIAATTQVFTPTLAGSNIPAPFIASTTSVFTPTLAGTGAATPISAPFIASTTSVFTATVVLIIQPPFIAATTQVFTPGLNAILAPFIGARASLQTALAGSNNDLVFTAVQSGTAGNDVSIAYVRAGVSQPLTVEVSDGQITVYLATDASGNVTSTAAQVKAALEAYAPASSLITIALASGNDGTGLVEPLTQTSLSGGTGTVGVGVFTPTRYWAPWGPGAGPSSTPPTGSTVSHAIYELQLCDRFGAHIADLTTITYRKKGEYRLNRPTIWSGRVPARSALVKGAHADGRPKLCSGYRALKVRRNGALVFHGYVLRTDRVADENEAWATFTAIDPLAWFHSRLVRDETGNFADPDYVSPISGGEIVRRMVTNTIGAASLHLSGKLEPPDGSIGLSLGTFDTAIPPAIDIGIKLGTWPLTMGEMTTLITESGVCDVAVNPTEGTPFVMGSIDAKNRVGSDKSGSVHLDFAQGDYSLVNVRYGDDMASLCNKLWYLLGIRKNATQWPANVTADDPLLPDPPQSAIESLIAQSRQALGVFMELRYHDWGSAEKPDKTAGERKLARKLWQTEAELRQKPRELLHVTPSPAAPYRPFDHYVPGDEIALNVHEDGLGIGLSGTQRVYGFDLMPDTEGVERVGELVTSAD